MNKKLIKKIGLGFVILAVFFGSLALALKLLFPTRAVKEMVESTLSRRLGREIRVEEFSFSILHGFAVDLRKFSIAAEKPSKTEPFLLNAERLLLRVRLWPLLRRRIEIVNLILIRPEIYLVKDERGELNTASLFSQKGAAPAGAEEKSKINIELLIISSKMQDGIIHYLDFKDTLDLRLDPVDLELSMGKEKAGPQVAISGKLIVGGLKVQAPAFLAAFEPAAPLDLSFNADFNSVEGYLSFQEIKLVFAGLKLDGKGKIENLGEEKAVFSFSLAGGAADLGPTLKLLLSPYAEKVKIESGGSLDLGFKINSRFGEEESPDYELKASLNGIKARLFAIPRPVEIITSSLLLKKGELELESLNARVGDNSLLLSGLLKLEKGTPRWSIDIKGPQFNLADILPPNTNEADRKTSGIEGESFRLPFPLGLGKGRLRFGKFVASEFLTLDNFDLSFRVKDNLITIESVKGGFFSGTLDGTGSIVFSVSGIPGYSLDFRTSGVSAGKALTPLTSFGKYLSGIIASRLRLEGSGAGKETFLKNLSGEGQFTLKSGGLADAPVQAALAQLTGIEGLKDISITELVGNITIRQGRVITEIPELKTSQGSWTGEGSFGFDGSLDYAVRLALDQALTSKYRPILTGELTNLLTDESGRLTLNFKISGTSANPIIRLDTSPLKRQVQEKLKSTLTRELDKLTGRLKPGEAGKEGGDSAQAADTLSGKKETGKVPDLLKKLFRKKPQPE